MKLLRLLLFTLSFTTTLAVNAYEFEANGLYFDFVSTGDLTCALTDGPSGHKYTGDLVIPDEVEYSGKKLKVVSIKCTLQNVSSVKLGKNITAISDNCFFNNSLISSITLPSPITEIGYEAFSGCTSLTSVKYEGDMVLSAKIFYGCTNLKNLSFKSVCKEIPNKAFKGCSSLSSIDLSKVEYIGSEAFNDCSSLKIIDLSSIKEITVEPNEKGNFRECSNISLLVLGPDISSIPSYAFYHCNIDSLALLPGKTALKFNTSANINSLYLGRVLSNASGGFYNERLNLVKVGALVTTLPDKCFKNCKNLSKIIFEGEDEIKIGDECFQGTNLKIINFPKGINILGRDVFPSCIESISFGGNVSFSNHSYPEIQRTFENIKDTSTLKQISFLSATPPIYYGKFGNQIYTSAKLLVPYGSKEAYQNTDPWRNFWNIEEMPGVNTEKIEITPVNANLHIGDTIKLTGTKSPVNSIDTIQWKSSDVKIATVSHDGIVTAISPGKTTISAISGKASATCEINVAPIAAEKIVLSHEKVSLNESDTIKITATIGPETTTDKTIKWASSDEKIATVSKDGVIKAIKVGTAKITAACGNVSAICEVTVLPIAAEKIVLNYDKVAINESDTITLTATISPETTTDRTIKWTSSNYKIASVSEDGLVTATGAGTATITATCGEISASCEVTVYEPNIEVEFTDNTLSITVECSESSTNVSIFTVFGQCIYRQTIKAAVVTKEEIDLAELPSGTYVVHVISDIMKISKRIVKTETK